MLVASEGHEGVLVQQRFRRPQHHGDHAVFPIRELVIPQVSSVYGSLYPRSPSNCSVFSSEW